MTTDYNDLIPQGILFNLREIEDMNIIKVDMAKKLIQKKMLEVVKIGNKLHVSRTELIQFLKRNTIMASDHETILECNKI